MIDVIQSFISLGSGLGKSFPRIMHEASLKHAISAAARDVVLATSYVFLKSALGLLKAGNSY